MRFKTQWAWVCGILLAVSSGVALADEATGTIDDTSFGAFKINDKGTIRQFNMARGKSQYAPATWRPMKGDEVKVTYAIQKNRRGTPVLAVGTVTLVKAGPDTVTTLESPVTVTIVETGTTGVKAKLPKGQVVKFDYQRGKGATEKLPAGWVEAIGEKAVITFHVQANRWTDSVGFVADKIEKVK